MSPFLQLALIIALILIAAKIAGYISMRLGQPSVLGEILIGIILGPSLLDVTHLGFVTDTHLDEIAIELGEIGVLILMFLAGLELHLKDLAKNTRVSAFAGSLGVLFPVVLGWLVGYLMGFHPNQALFLGLTLGATSVSISAQTLMELNALRSRVGLGLLGAAVFDDVLVILLLSSFLAVFDGSGGSSSVLLVVVRMSIFLVLSVLFGLYGLPRLSRLVRKLPISQGSLTLAIVVLLLYGVTAELIGEMAAITGSFIAGLMFARTTEKTIIENGMRSIAYSLFVPIFFISIGLTINIRSLDFSAFWLMLLISAIAIISKILGAGLGSRIAKFSWKESLQMGIGMVSRGEVGLIVAQVGVSQDLITPEVFSAVIGMVVITTLVTPPLLRFVFQKTNPVELIPQDVPSS